MATFKREVVCSLCGAVVDEQVCYDKKYLDMVGACLGSDGIRIHRRETGCGGDGQNGPWIEIPEASHG